ncbi:MAG: hypothetical protein E6Q92_02710 [Burkholderiaceae bacterium]|nr:MAG: hypothetical protein E6Q92_02710 [Burkholderiaceae bacterium]
MTDSVDAVDWTAPHWAAYEGDVDRVRWRLAQGANPSLAATGQQVSRATRAHSLEIALRCRAQLSGSWIAMASRVSVLPRWNSQGVHGLKEGQLAGQLVSLTNRWGTHFGGINALNTGLMRALGRHDGCKGITLICIVELATDDEREQSRNCGVRLVETGVDMLSNDAATVDAVASLAGTEAPVIWLGHDDKTGPLALALRRKLGGKAVLFNHMAHVAYQGFKKGDSLSADEKKELQRELFLQADHAVCVGPRLHAELDDLLGTAPDRPKVTMLMPGLDEPSEYHVKYRKTQPKHFRGFAAGRLALEDDRIKQGRLAFRGFVMAVEGQIATGKIPNLTRSPRVCLMGVTKAQEGELRTQMESWASRQLHAELIPFTENRTKYFRELASSSFAMMLSWHEGFGLVGWEAIAARVPLILGKNSGLWQFLKDEVGAAHVEQCLFPLDIRGHWADEENNENHRIEDVEAVKDAIEKIAALGNEAKKAAISLHDLIVEKGWTWDGAARDFFVSIEPLFTPRAFVAQTGCSLPGSTNPPPSLSPQSEPYDEEDMLREEFPVAPEQRAQPLGIPSLRNPFKQSLAHWTVDDEKPLPGRPGDVHRIVAAMASHGDLVLLKGRSGCGKSSLMQSGVMRRLREMDGSVLVPFRPTELMAGSGEGDALDRLASLIAGASSVRFSAGGPKAMRPVNYAKGLRKALESHHVTLVLGLDQFEEIIDELKLERERSAGASLKGWWPVISFLKALCGSPRVRLIATLESAREQSFQDLCIGEEIGLMPKTFNVDATDDTVAEIAQSGFALGGLPLDPAAIEALKIKWRAFERETPGNHASPLPLACLFLHRLYERFADQAGTTPDERLENAFAKAGSPDKDHQLTLEEIGGEDAIAFADIIQDLADEAWRAAGDEPHFADPIETDKGFRGLNNFLKPLVTVDHDGQIQLRSVVEANADEPARRRRKAFRERRLLVPVPGLKQGRVRPVHQALIDRWPPARRWAAYRKEQLQIVQRFREDAAYWHQRGKPVPQERDGSTLRAAALTLLEHLLEWTGSPGTLGKDDAVLRVQALAVFDTAEDPFTVLEGSTSGLTYAHLAASYHRVDLLRRFIAFNPECLILEEASGQNLLHSAAWQDGPAVHFLIEQGVPLKTKRSQWSAISAPIIEKLNDNFDAMIGHLGIDDPIEMTTEGKMIHFAAMHSNMYVIEHLTKHGAVLDSLDNQESTALLYAAQYDQAEAFRCLLPHIDVQKQDRWKRTAISFAAQCGAVNILSTYLTEEADPDRLSAILSHRDNLGDTPLMISARCRQPEALRALLQPDLGELGDPSAAAHRGEDGDTLFHLIFRGASDETPREADRFRARTVVEMLLRDGRLDPNLPNDKGETPFDLGRDFPEARRVLRQDERVPQDYARMTPSMRIEDLSSRRPTTVLRLLKAAPQALTDKHDLAPERRPMASTRQKKESAAAATASGGETGLEILIRLKSYRVLATLAGDRVHWPTLRQELQKLFDVAAVPSAERLRGALQRRVANGEIDNKEASELLGACVDAGDFQAARGLFCLGVPLSLRRDDQGMTVLHNAATTGDVERFQSVLAIGSFALPRDKWGRCPSDLAAELLVQKFRALEADMKHSTEEKGAVALASSIVGLPPFLSLERNAESRSANETEMMVLQMEWKEEWGIIDELDISVFDQSFHPGVPLIELRPRSSSLATGRICFLLLGDKLYRLNGTSPPIHEVNGKKNPLIDEKTVLSYLAFFCFFVRGEEGPFLIVDRRGNGFLPDLSGSYGSNMNNAFRPPQVWGQDGLGNWLVSGLVYYSNAIFFADFQVQSSGMIEVVGDATVLTDLPARVESPLEIRSPD